VTHEGWLQTLAEVAVALAGFSGLLAGVRHRSEQESRINVTRLRTIIETSLPIVALSLLPTLLNGLGLGEIAAFRISALVFLAGLIPLGTRGFLRFRAASGISGRPSLLMSGTYLASAISLVSAVACAFGLGSSIVPTLYLMALASALAIGAFNFVGFAVGLGGESPG
jgi:hypothetical protein